MQRVFRLPEYHIATMVGPDNGSTYEFIAEKAGEYEFYLDEASDIRGRVSVK